VSYGFEDAAVVAGAVCDSDYSTHHPVIGGVGQPVVNKTPGFQTWYADTLCADGTKAMHSCAGTSGGAKIGVVDNASPRIGPGSPGTSYSSLQAAGGTKFYQIMAAGVDGFTYVCFDTVTYARPMSVKASIKVYVAQAGWHETPDRLRAWVETSATQSVSLLPRDTDGSCVTEVDKHNIDRLQLRDSANGTEWTGAHNAPGDPAILADQYVWKTLTADLGSVTSAKVCAGLQTGAGHELLWLDNMQLVASTSGTAASCPVSTPDYSNPCVSAPPPVSTPLVAPAGSSALISSCVVPLLSTCGLWLVM
jgi:hypothetical protein